MKIQKEKTVIIKKSYIWSAIAIFLVITVCLVATVVREKNEMKLASNNDYNMAFYELVDYVQNVETYLAKSLISSTPEHGAETLTKVWRESNLALSYLTRLPMESNELSNTARFLNQVSEYSYSLSRKNIYNESLTEEDLLNKVKIAKVLGYSGISEDMDLQVQTKGYRILNKVHRLPASIIENLVNYFGNFQEILHASIEELDEVEGIGEIRATYIRNGLIKLKVVLGNGHI